MEKQKDGLEYQLGINHFGHFRLTMNLLQNMVKASKESGEGRIVNVSSSAHNGGRIDFEDLPLKNGYSRVKSYSRSKMANILFSNELNRKFKEDKIPIFVNSLMPGVIATELTRDIGIFRVFLIALYPIFLLMSKTIPQGATTTLYAATSNDIKEGGLYLEDNGIGKVDEYSNDKDVQKKLWDISEKLTDKHYKI